MVYKFKLVSDEVSNFSREIEIDSTSSFLQLRNVILDSVGYTKDDMCSFFLCDDQWNREEEITLTDMGSSSDQDVWIMEDTALNEFIEEEGQKLSFVFDYFTERSFFMEMKEEIPGKSLSEPICTMKRGNPPAQHTPLEEFEKQVDAAAKKQMEELDLDVDLYGDTDFNEDEISGYEEMDFNG
ncbi:MAG: hypothetical protein K2J48_02600 [Muribaculaceae bacterium]|nr:hypothetical protein [Muribaculaceae bacterium]MDE6008155.1 hypothetical protein [Muribaculaceae bacterium]MDE6791961.1 hypothetical protein [Muribaculaceae bacterium]